MVGWQAVLKRALDLIVAIPVFLLSLPLMLLVGLLVRIDSPGPAIFCQVRVGQRGRHFTVYKFRTMYVSGAGLELPRLANLDDFVFQHENDPRVTRAGRFLRRTSLDELPQLWNVIRGEMSLVGPRPEVPEIVEMYDEKQWRRLLAKPGLTGLAQVHGRGRLTTGEAIRYDLQYVNSWSIWLDLWILFRTVGVVLLGWGAR